MKKELKDTIVVELGQNDRISSFLFGRRYRAEC